MLSLDKYLLEATAQGVYVHFGTQKHRIGYKWMVVRFEPWPTLRSITFASSQATRANLPALAVFGVLGLAARREPGTMIAVSYPDGDVFFSTRQPFFQIRAEFARLEGAAPAARGKIQMY